MPDFIRFSIEYSYDGVHFERPMNMAAFTEEKYREYAVHYSHHPSYPGFVKILQNPTFKDEIIMCDLGEFHKIALRDADHA